MVALWFPKEELKADLEDQARKRLEEIQREAEKRRNAIVQQAQSGLNDERLQDAMSRFNQMVDPLFDKGRGMIDGAAQGVQDTAARAQELVQQAQQGIEQAPTLDAFQNLQGQTPPSPTPGITSQTSTPPPEVPEVPEVPQVPEPPEIPQTPPPRGIDGMASMLSSSFTPPGLPGITPPGMDGTTDGLPQPQAQLPGPPGFPGLGRPPEGPPGFKPPGLPDTSGLGTALAGRIREGMDAAGQGIGGMAQETGDRMGRNLAGWGDELRGMAGERRDDALEVVNKSLDIAREAVANAEPNLRQTPIGRWAQQEFPRGAIDLVAGQSAAAKAAEATAPWTPQMEEEQQAWEGVQGQEREGRGLEGLLAGAGHAARRYEQQTREQGETLFGQGTKNENPLERLQAGFGYGMAPYGVLPEVARGGVEEATGSPLAGSVAYGAASILGPGGIAKFLRESGPLALRMATNPAMARQIASAAGAPATLKALALGLVGGVGGVGFGAKTGVDALRGGSTPQEAAAIALTNAADLLQISEAAGIPIDAGARLLRAFPDLRPRLPSIPGMPSAPEMPGAPQPPRLPTPGEAPPPMGQEGTLTPEPELAPESAPEEGLGGREPDRPDVTTRGRPQPIRPRPLIREGFRAPLGEAELAETGQPRVSRARQLEDAEQIADEAAARAQERQGPPPSQGPLGFLRRFGEELGGAQGQGPQQGVMFGNAPTTEVVGRGQEARRVGAIEQTIGGPAGGRMTGEGAREGGVSLTPGRVIPETEISRFGQIRRGAETISPETGALTGTIEDRLLRAYREKDLTADEEKALGVGAPGDPQRGGLLGEPRVASFRHPGWMARNYTPDYEAGVMRYETPDKETMAQRFPTWKPHLRFGPKGDYQYTEIKPKKGASALDVFDEGDDAGPGPSGPPWAKGEKKGTKVLLDTATGEEINITRHPDMPWKQEQMPITDTTGMTRDGRIEEVASTPLSYQRAALLRGLGLRNFYPDYGRFFGEDLARNSKTLFKELNAIFGAVASQASPETNLQRALAVMSAGRHFMLAHPELNRPPDFNELTVLTSTNFDRNRMHYTPLVTEDDLGRFPAGGITGADVKKVVEIWETGGADIGAGWKTPVFGQNLESGALNRADPLSVPDTHMFRGRGHTQTGGGPPQSVNSDLRALGITNATVVRLADEFGLTPFQVQSALWFVYKNELAPFNATDKAQIRNKMAANGTDWNTEAARHDPWPKAMEEGPDGKPRVMTVPGPDGQPMEVRQGTLPAVLRHVANVAGRTPPHVKGQPRVARPRMDLMKAFRDLDTEFSQKVGRDSLTELAGDARLTFNGKLVTNPSRGGTVDLDIPGEGTQRVRSMEITPENIERAAFKASQEAPVAIVPMDGADGEGLGRLGYDSQRGQIEVLRQASIPHEVILTNRPFTAGEPGKAETKDTTRILFPGASLDTARYAASLLGERVGADEVAVSWPTRPGRGRPVVSIEHPEGLPWTTEEIAKHDWAAALVGRANVSPDGRTLFFADLKPEESKSVPWAERVQAVLEDAGVPPELVRRTADFGIERVGAEQYGDVLSRAPLQTAGELGQRAQAQFEAGEAVPGSTPTAADLREYAGPERFRPEGAPVGSLGIREGLGGRPSPLRDTLDERLQIGQGVLGAAVGAKQGDEYDEEDTGLQRAGRILGGGLGGAIAGVNAPNARRLLRAAGRAAGPVPGADLARLGAAPERRAVRDYSRYAPEQATYHNDPEAMGSSFNPARGNLGEEKVFMVGAFPLRTWEIEGTHEVTQAQFEKFAAQNEDLLDAFPQLSIGTWKDTRPDGTKYVALDLSMALDNHDNAVQLGHRLRQKAIHQMEGHNDIDMQPDQFGPELTTEEETIDAIERVLGQGALTAGRAGARPAPGGLAGAAAGTGQAEPGAGAGGYAPDAGLAPDRGRGPADGGLVGRLGDTLRRLGEQLAGDEAGVLGAVAKGPGEGGAPRRGEQGPDVGLGDLDDPENLARQILNPPEGGWQGTQQQELIRAMARRVKNPAVAAEGAKAEQVEAERVRRLARRQEGVQRVEEATTPEEVADAAADAEDAAQKGEMPHSDADAVRGRAARKLQQRKGADGPPEPGEMDRQIEASKARREAEKVTGPTREQEREGLGVERPQEEFPQRVNDPYEDVEAGGPLTPEDDATQRAYIEQQRARKRPGPLPPPLPPPVGRVDTPPPQGEPHAGRGPELGPAARAVELGPAPARVTSGSKAERDQAAARAKYLRRPSARVEAVTPVTSLETEAALAARATEPAERGIPRLIAPDGTFLTRAQVAAQLARDAARPGGWGAIRDEWNEGLSDAGRLLAAAGRGIKVAPQEFDRALAQVGRGLGSRERWEGLPKNAKEKLTSFRPEHIFDAMGTYQRINMVVTPEGFGRNFLSTTIALPLRFYEAATAPLFDRAWGVLPGQGDRGPNAAHSYEAVAMAEGLYRSWAAGIANAMNVGRKGDERLTRAQTGDDAGDFQNTRMGKAMGTLFRPMTATDAFLKTLNEGMEAYRLAYRQAKNEFDAGKLRHDGRSIRSRMIEIMSVPEQKFIDQVQQAGEYNTYNQKAGRLANLMEGFKNLPEGTHPAVAGAWRLLMNTIIPFVRISTNVMKFGLERTIPGGLISTAMGQGRQDRSERFAKMTEGALMLGGLWGAQQAGMIEVSGALPEDDTEREEWVLQGKTPYSVRIGDRWYNPQAFPGVMENVTMLGMMGDTKRKLDEKEAAGEEVGIGDYLSEIPGGVAQYLGQVGVRPAFGSVVNAIGAMTAQSEGQRQYYRDELQRGAIGQVAPASGLMRQIGNLTDRTQRAPEGAAEQLAAIYPWWRENIQAKTNALGEEMESEGYRWPLAGLTSSKAASDTTEPRKYRGSESAAMDRQITRAIEAVNAYERDRKGNPRPTTEEKRLARRYRSRLNPRRQKLDERVRKMENRREEDKRRAIEGGYAENPFAFRVPGIFQREEEVA